jgi:hypothetical protein
MSLERRAVHSGSQVPRLPITRTADSFELSSIDGGKGWYRQESGNARADNFRVARQPPEDRNLYPFGSAEYTSQ